MNKKIKIVCLSVLSLSLLSGTQVQALPSFKKSAGCAVLAAGVTYALWQNKDKVKDSIQDVRDSMQERKNKAQEWFNDQFGECKEKMGETKELVLQALSEKKDALQSWAEEKSNNSGLSDFFSRFQKKRGMVSSDAVNFDPHSDNREPDIEIEKVNQNTLFSRIKKIFLR